MDDYHGLFPYPQRMLKRQHRRSNLNPTHTTENVDLEDFSNDIPTATFEGNESTRHHDEGRFGSFAAQTINERPQALRDAPCSENTSSTELHKSRGMMDQPPFEDFIRVKASEGTLRAFVWPALVICIPMMLMSASLLFIVFKYMIRKVDNIFDSIDRPVFMDKKYLLVDFPSTKLVFLASFLSTLAPLLAGSIMTLTATLVYQELRESSDVSRFPHLPTVYQVSLLIGVLAASYEQLFMAFSYLLSRKRTAKASPVLLYAMSIFLLSVVLGVAVTVTDAYLHVATQTVEITLYSDETAPSLELGSGVSSFCLTLDRVNDNFGFPCTFAATSELATNPEFKAGRSEVQRIAHNTSSSVEMELTSTSQVPGGRIAFLKPAPAEVPAQTNYQATTIGAATQCSLMPPTMCNITTWGDGGFYTSFNCSSQFWGTLGLQPPVSELGKSGKVVSPYLSFLAINQNTNLIYNYFADQSLEIVYNTMDLNESAKPKPDAEPWPDAELKDTIYMAFAWRTSKTSFSGSNTNGMVLSNMVQQYQNFSYIDYFLNCEVSTYDVTYTWFNGSLLSLDASKHTNGSILNMWAATADWTPSVSGTDWNLQDFNVQSAIAGNTTASYEQRFGELVSQDALAQIGAYTSPRRVLQQQPQTQMLVARVPKSALGALLACSLIYPILGIALLVKARKAAKDSGPMAPLFSYWGLASAAFLENRSQHNDNGSTVRPKPPYDHEEVLRLFIRPDNDQGHRFGLFRRSVSGQVTELERSQVKVSAWI